LVLSCSIELLHISIILTALSTSPSLISTVISYISHRAILLTFIFALTDPFGRSSHISSIPNGIRGVISLAAPSDRSLTSLSFRSSCS
jgi:hypothetical protein